MRSHQSERRERKPTSNHDDIGAKIRDVTQRLQRKAVLITGMSGVPLALESAKTHARHVSDLVVLGPPGKVENDRFRSHFVSLGWSLPFGPAHMQFA